MTPDRMADRLLKFAVSVGRTVDALPDTPTGRHVARRLLRSGTRTGTVYDDACSAETHAEYVGNLKALVRSLRESRYWLRLIAQSGILPDLRLTEVQEECGQLCNLTAQSLVNAQALDREEPKDVPTERA